MAEPKFNEKNGVELSPELKSSLDLIQDATLVHVHHNNHHNEILSFSQQLNIASPHMPPHHYLVDSDDEIDESDDDDDDELDYDFVNDDDYEDSDIDDNDFNEKIKLEVFSRPPSRLGRPLSNPYKRQNKRNGPSVDRIKMDNAFLRNQNSKLSQELDQCRLTIQALKNIVTQKDIALQNSRSDYQKAILQVRVLEALILSKHSKDGSIIVRSGGIGGNNLPTVATLLQEKELISEKESLKNLIVPEKPSESDSIETTPQVPNQILSTQPSLLESTTDFIGSSDDDDYDDDDTLPPPPLPPKRANRPHTRRWSMDFGPNNRLGQEEEGSIQLDMISSNITQKTSSDDNTIISSSGTTPSSSTLTPINNDLQRNLPRILRRRTGDIIQTLASCRSSTKNGYDHSPPSTPFERGSDDSNETVVNETVVNETVINEKSTKKRKSAQQNLSKLRKMFLR